MSGYYQKFDWSITGKKLVVALVGVSAMAGLAGPLSDLAQYVIASVLGGSFGESETAKDALWVIFTGVGSGILAGLRNWWKNADAIKYVPFLLIGALALSLQGCASTMPALAGKTDLTTEFRDVVVGENQDTYYRQTIKAPAGVELDNIASMGYQWKDGEGAINVNNQAAADTTYQADALVQVNAQQMDLIKAMMDQIVSLAGLAQPLIGQNLTNRANQGQIDAANKAALQAQVIQLFKDPAVLGALQNIGAARAQYVPKMELSLPE